MKTRKWIGFLSLGALFSLAACGGGIGDGSGSGDGSTSAYFWAANMTTDEYYQTKATKLYTGTHCVVWAEDSAGVSYDTARDMAREYDNYIHNTVVNAVGLKGFYYQSKFFNDIMELGDWMTDRDGKLTILLLDIKDGFNPPTNRAYVGGYFTNVNLYADGIFSGHRSNKKDMIYIDTNPGLTNEKYIQSARETLAHEMQHLVNELTSDVKRGGSQMDTWINEGISLQMEQLYRKKRGLSPEYIQDNISWFNGGSGSKIKDGNNFYVWGGAGAGDSILDEYATAYLFFQWLYQQNNKSTATFYNIVTSTYPDYRAVVEVAQNIKPLLNSWEVLLRTWLAANYIQDSTSLYGYKNAFSLTKQTTSATSVNLKPGEAVYSKINGNYSRTDTGNIKYVGLKTDDIQVGSSSGHNFTTSDGDHLLVFNANTSRSGNAEDGKPTGVASVIPASMSIAPSSAPQESYRIDARDLLGRRDRDRLPTIMLAPLGSGDE
ncbi:hypothetical protein FACS189487_06340 [Campylobacterota bacterium]|nr:hypothetical protein FACS189487_06340 [Campylobacterota bacterium]